MTIHTLDTRMQEAIYVKKHKLDKSEVFCNEVCYSRFCANIYVSNIIYLKIRDILHAIRFFYYFQ